MKRKKEKKNPRAFSYVRVKPPVVTWGFRAPLEVLNSERSQCYVLLILLLEFGDNRAAEYFIFSSCLDWELYSSVQGVSPDMSHSRHKQSYYMSKTRFRGKLNAGSFGVVLWQYIVEIQTVMLHCSLGRTIVVWLWMLPQSLWAMVVVVVEFVFFFLSLLQSCACKWEFMFCNDAPRYGFWIAGRST